MRKLLSLPISPRRELFASLDGLISTGEHTGILADAIRGFKYDGAIELADALAARMTAVVDAPQEQVDCLLPVPLAEKRMAERGYNQSALLCQRLSDAWQIDWRDDLLRRTRETEQQARLRGHEREDNVRGAFQAAPVDGMSLLLVDDVVTTGATLIECAKALKQQGAFAVYAITVCRA